jgi:hypothetical protein
VLVVLGRGLQDEKASGAPIARISGAVFEATQKTRECGVARSSQCPE